MTSDLEPLMLQGTLDEFVADVSAAVGVWGQVVWLPIVSLLLGGWGGVSATDGSAAAQGSGVTTFLVLLLPLLILLTLFSLGWAGAERLVYARVWAGLPTTLRHAVGSAWGYLGRFLVLGLILVIPVLLASLVLSLALGQAVSFAVVRFALFAFLTFVTPALTFDEDTAMRALRRGWRVLRQQGGRAVWYAVVGPMLLTLLSFVTFAGGLLYWTGWAALGLAALLLKGATAAAYLRLTRPLGIHAPPPTGP